MAHLTRTPDKDWAHLMGRPPSYIFCDDIQQLRALQSGQNPRWERELLDSKSFEGINSASISVDAAMKLNQPHHPKQRNSSKYLCRAVRAEPGPSMTGISPAGVGIDSKFVEAILKASLT